MCIVFLCIFFLFFNDTATTEMYTYGPTHSLHDALPIFSLGISGQKDAGIAILDPLLREQDRAAWRDRAFILAMNGDVDEAEKIAKAMMPGPVSEGLQIGRAHV